MTWTPIKNLRVLWNHPGRKELSWLWFLERCWRVTFGGWFWAYSPTEGYDVMVKGNR